MELSWGVELWDNFDTVDKHVHHGIEFMEKYMKFTKDRCSIEMEYAKMIRRLVKNYTPKKKEDDYAKFSTHKALQCQLSELNDIAGQHEIIAETMQANIVRDLHEYSNEVKIEKKRIHQEGKQMQSHLEASERNLDQVKRKFEKEWRESERAQLYYEKLDADVNVTKAEVEKAKATLQIKKDFVEQCKGDYASVLINYNKEQTAHYDIKMPKVFEDYRRLDERRIKKTASVMEAFSNSQAKVFPIIEKCIAGMKQSARAVDPDLDSRLVVEKYKSGFLPPNEKEFEDYTSPQQNHLTADGISSSPRNSITMNKAQNKKGLSWLFGGKKPGNLLKSKNEDSNTTADGRPVISGPLGGIDFGMSMGVDCRPIEELNAENNSKNTEANNDDENIPETSPEKSSTPEEKKTSYVNVEIGAEPGDVKIIDDPVAEEVAEAEVHNDSPVKPALPKVSPDKPQRPPAPTFPRKSQSLKKLDEDTSPDGKSIRQSLVLGKKKFKSMFNKNEPEKSPPPVKPPRKSIRNRASTSSNTPELEHTYTEVTLAAEAPDYSHLPPEQRRKKLNKIVDDLRQQHSKQVDGRNALLKMQEVYRKNQQLGDPASLDQQMRSITETIDKLELDLRQHEDWLKQCTASVNRLSGSHQSYKPQASYNQPSHSPAHSGNNLQVNEPIYQDQSFGDDFEDEESVEPIGTCKALYNFDATSEGAMSMKEGDSLQVLEKDKGDGWTRVLNNNIDGYVPTTYLEVKLF